MSRKSPHNKRAPKANQHVLAGAISVCVYTQIYLDFKGAQSKEKGT